MIAPHLKVVGAFRPWPEPSRVVRLGRGPLRIEVREGDLFNIWRSEQAAIIGMEDVGLIVLVRDADPRTRLPLVIETLDLVIPETQVQSPVIAGTPLILEPEFLPPLRVSV